MLLHIQVNTSSQDPLAENQLLVSIKQIKKWLSALPWIDQETAADSFGIGQDPRTIFKTIPADYIKLGRSLMNNFRENPQNQEAVKEIVGHMKVLNREAIAQFVEDADTLSILWGLGINLTQGNFLQKPMLDTNYDFSSIG